jgi:hypothetical protein
MSKGWDKWRILIYRAGQMEDSRAGANGGF